MRGLRKSGTTPPTISPSSTSSTACQNKRRRMVRESTPGARPVLARCAGCALPLPRTPSPERGACRRRAPSSIGGATTTTAVEDLVASRGRAMRNAGMRDDIPRRCAECALAAGRAIRDLVHAMPPHERAVVRVSLLKPHGGYGARHVDAAAEEMGLAHLEALAKDLGCVVAVLIDPATGATHRIGRGSETIWASMDAIDGTVKVAGLGAPEPDRVRLANDGAWAAGFAFTLPTTRALAELTFGDFVIAVVVDGNPSRYGTYPQDLVALPGAHGLVTWEATEEPWRRVHTASSDDLGQLWAYLDVFQAHDRDTRLPGDEALGVELYRLLSRRHEGGAFDVLRQYANLSALPRVLFGWREPPVWVESQGGAFVVVNENVPNLIPSVPLVLGAGGVSVDFSGRPLAARPLSAGRTSVLHAANTGVSRRILALIAAAAVAARR